ncbi:MAG: hypothetical protein D6786_01360 [Gammaproteobacteria bacterium]|nr:MAG: hypothetical protein D6786_01360 [Gammaproteobacteria bacterium]
MDQVKPDTLLLPSPPGEREGSRPPRPARSLRLPPLQFSLVVAVFVLGLGSSLAGFHALQLEGRGQVYEELDRHAATLARQLQTHIDISLESLRTIAAFYQASGSITHAQLADFVHSDARFHAGTVALGWVPRVPARRREQFEREVRSQGNPGFRIYQVTGHGLPVFLHRERDSYPVQALISLIGQPMKEGLDLASLPPRWRILERAARRRDVAVSGRTTLYGTDGERVTVHAFYPVYSRQRQEDLLGFAMGIFDVRAFARGILDREGGRLGFVLHDEDAGPGERLLYQSGLDPTPSTGSAGQTLWRHRIRVGDRRWELAAYPLPGALAQAQAWRPYGGLFAGLSLTALLTLYLFLAQHRAHRLLRLEKALEDQRIELAVQRRLKEEAEQSGRAKSRLLRVASHDLRQPLDAIGLLTSLLRDCRDTAEREELIGRIRIAVGGLREMFDDLLEISRLETGKMPVRVGTFPLGPLLGRLEAEYAPVAARRGLTLRVHPCRLRVRSDPRLLERILRNLLSNAIRYTRAGRVVLGCRPSAGKVRIQVLDSGIGIAAAEQEAVFGEFYRGDEAGGLAAGGLGLGLSIVRQIVRLLGHELRISSIPGRGSCFTIEVPAER